MKKFLYSLIGLAVMLSSASCEQELRNAASDGDEVEATFSVALDGLQTKAYSDGKSATKLQVLVYNPKGFLANVSKEQDIPLRTTVNLKLVKGETYNIVFWAQDPTCTAYNIDKTNAKLTVTTTGDANDEKRDAFYNAITFGPVEGPINQTVELRRPFAQINVLDNIDDWNAAVDNGINFTGSSMRVKAPNVLDLKNGAASGEAEYTFGVKAINPDADSKYPILSKEDGTQLYKYIAMNYILAGEKDTKDVKFGVYRDNETSSLYSTDVPNVPYKRNFRTIIMGNIFAVDGVFNVIIVPEYETPDYIVPLDGDPQTITPSTTAPIASADGYSYNADTQTGTVSTVAGNTLNFAGVVTSNSPFAPEYYSSNTSVGTIDKTTGAFTAVAAGTTVVTIHYNAVQNDVEVKSDEPLNLAAADIKFTVTVTAAEPTEAVAAPVFSVAAGEVEAGTKVELSTTTEGATIYYSLTDAAPATEYKEAIEITEAVTIKAIAKKEGMTDSEIATAAYTVKAVTPSNHGKVASDPFTVAEARAYIDEMEDPSKASTEDIFVAGVISAIKYTFNSNFGTATFTMTADGAESEETFVAYGAYYKAHEQKWTDTDTQIAIADKVVVCGKVLKYTDGTYETSNKNGYVVSIERGPVAFGATIDNTDEVVAGGGTKTITITGNVDWTVEGTTGLTFSATSGFGAATVKVTVPANTDTENGKEWTVNVKTAATGVSASSYPFNFSQGKATPGANIDSEKVVFAEQGYANQTAIETYTGSTFAISFDKGSNSNAPKYYSSGEAVRCYGGNTFTVSASKAIKKVILSFGSSDGTNEITTTPGEFAAENSTWTGDSTSVAFTIGGTSGNRRIAAVEVFYVVD